jgi:acetolactate synthase-1/2/3 large subunit
MILPADAAWGETRVKKIGKASPVIKPVIDDHQVKVAVKAIRAHPGRCGILLDGEALHAENLALVEEIAARHDVDLYVPVFISRLSRGLGRPSLKRIPYPVDDAVAMLAHLDVLILVGAIPPVAFFAYPGKPSALTPKTCKLISLATVRDDIPDALARLGEALGGQPLTRKKKSKAASSNGIPTGSLTEDAVAVLLARALPDQAIISDEALTSARRFYALSENAPPHDYMMVTGGAIGVGIPLSTGAAVACPNRKTIALQADGSGMYTLQGLWTQARERLDVVTIILNNRGYAILQHEMKNVGVPVHGGNADRMMRIDDPGLNWVSLAAGMGVEGARATTCKEFSDLLEIAFRRKGPFLIEAMI